MVPRDVQELLGLLKQLHLLVDQAQLTTCLQEVLILLKQLPQGQTGMTQLQQLCSTWAGRWPSLQQLSAEVTLAVLHSRRLLLDSLAAEWRGKADRQAFVVKWTFWT